jgi:EAL domain-containing protein (putative c-di-GMP-specific phosphodiesterase class I)
MVAHAGPPVTYLKRLRLALLKIDQSFVRNMLDDSDDLTIQEWCHRAGRCVQA